MATPWYTSQTLVEAVQRKIALPLSQKTFSSDDILSFANEEMAISQVPDLLTYHQEYYVWSEDIVMVANQLRYQVPDRAMGMKLRDIYYKDLNGNLFEMSRINADDKAYWQRESGTINIMQKYYMEGNDIVLAPQTITNVTGWLRMSYFIRPNQLVDNSRAAIISSFFTNVTVTVANMNVGDTLQVGIYKTFTAVSGSPTADQFLLGATDALTATNLANAINTDGAFTATVANNIVSVGYTDLTQLYYLTEQQLVYNEEEFDDYSPIIEKKTTLISSNPAGMNVSNNIGLVISGGVPANITSGSLVDLMQTAAGHKIYAKDITLATNSVSTNSIMIHYHQVPITMVVGDYVASQYECIIPYLPTDLHNGLAERVCARILEAQGDQTGAQSVTAKLADIKRAEGILAANRVDGSSVKVNQRKSPLSWMRMGIRRRI